MISVSQQKPKKEWVQPTVQVFGAVEQITLQFKTIGLTDGIILIPDNVLLKDPS